MPQKSLLLSRVISPVRAFDEILDSPIMSIPFETEDYFLLASLLIRRKSYSWRQILAKVSDGALRNCRQPEIVQGDNIPSAKEHTEADVGPTNTTRVFFHLSFCGFVWVPTVTAISTDSASSDHDFTRFGVEGPICSNLTKKLQYQKRPKCGYIDFAADNLSVSAKLD